MSSWLSSILAGALGRLLTGLVDWLLKKLQSYSKGSEYVEETKKRVESLQELQDKAKKEVEDTGAVSEQTKEDIRKAGRNLIRGKRD